MSTKVKSFGVFVGWWLSVDGIGGRLLGVDGGLATVVRTELIGNLALSGASLLGVLGSRIPAHCKVVAALIRANRWAWLDNSSNFSAPMSTSVKPR